MTESTPTTEQTQGCCLLTTYTIYFCFVIGIMKLLIFIHGALTELVYYSTRKPRNLYLEYGIPRSKEQPEGSYAVVTGASDGIGLAYCKHLAKQGFNILMISRSEEKLQKAKDEVEKYAQNKDVKVEYIVSNLSELTTYQSYVDKFAKKFSEIDIGILINNAGIGFTGPYYDMTSKEAESVFSLNCFHPIYLSKMLLNQQLKRPVKSAFVGVSSLMGFHSFPTHTYYCSSKIYVRYLYEGLNFEMQSDKRTKGKIDFQCYKPGFVATKLSRKTKGFTIPDTMKATEGALMDLGKRDNTYGVIDHHIIGWFLQVARKWIPGVLNFILYKEGTMTNKMLRDKNHSFI